MRTGPPAAHSGYFHETCFYASDDELLAVVVPFLLDGVAAGEPTIVAFGEHNTALTRSALGDASGVRFIDGAGQYPRPATTIREYRALFAQLVADGATQIRVVGDVPHPGTGASWDAWSRYEAIVNDAYAEFPIWGLCPYDTRITPADVLRDVRRTHPHVATADGQHVPNPAFESVDECLRSFVASPPHPIERTTPAVEMKDPLLHAARSAAAAVAGSARLDEPLVDDFVLVVAELITNAIVHGQAPVTVRMWADDEQRAVVTVSDGGDGPHDPGVGLMPSERAPGLGGLGLWIVHQVATEVALRRDADGFTVRAVVGRPLA